MDYATDMKTHLGRLAAERLEAREAGLEDNATYMDELGADLAAARHACVLSAVTESRACGSNWATQATADGRTATRPHPDAL